MNHKKNKTNALLATVFMVLFSTIAMAQSQQKVDDIIKDCDTAKTEFLDADFEMEQHFSNAYGYIIFPNVGKGAIWVGGAIGNGIAYEQGKMIGVVKLSQVNVGLQLGGQAYREVIFFKNKQAFDKIKNNKNKVKLAAQVSAVAVTEGASANAEYNNGVMIFTMEKGGLMCEASVGGQRLKFKPFRKKY